MIWNTNNETRPFTITTKNKILQNAFDLRDKISQQWKYTILMNEIEENSQK